MKEYIDREAVKKSIRRAMESICPKPDHQYEVGYNNGLTMAIAILINATAADVVEVVHGEWIEDEYEGVIVCSYCGVTPLSHPESMNTYVLSRFCPNCGAKMDGGNG